MSKSSVTESRDISYTVRKQDVCNESQLDGGGEEAVCWDCMVICGGVVWQLVVGLLCGREGAL